ncbi:tripartite tricarboxylate transporter substrate binding protein [Ramlibacter sp. AW1]|uniref:Tripartite tricarboxylate transporter substrate binding protein n=1 Tax=Ramlibacter aurantiacus TaxID=2801330 RepID=A0A936ZVF1_9BURK|nr:tripartite tricarboxylate transporter substrate binding protein [Ramlibacter aurantiacus]MBL0421860.1 tripartite tricarboxylate transporter substrate binding protein [Ramlibacter aurantiacus]
MTFLTRRALGLALLAFGGSALAQARFPDGPLRIIVPFAPGGGVDSAARLIGKQLSSNLNVPVVVENRPGANGSVGGKVVQSAPPDGQTLLFSASTQALTKQVMANPPYDPLTDFAPVARVGAAPLMMVISPALPQSKLSEVISAAKQNPDQWTAALPALGAASHLGTLMFAKEGGLNKLTTVVYKGTAPALTDVAGGHVQIQIDAIVAIQGMAKAGKVKPIMVTSAKRSPVMPNVPTAIESGYPRFVTESWYGMWAPKATPAERVQVLNKAINEAVGQLARAGAFEPLGIDPVTESVDEFRKYMTGYVAESADLLKSAGFKPE